MSRKAPLASLSLLLLATLVLAHGLAAVWTCDKSKLLTDLVASGVAHLVMSSLLFISAWGARRGRLLILAIIVLSYMGTSAIVGTAFILASGIGYRASNLVKGLQLAMIPVYIVTWIAVVSARCKAGRKKGQASLPGDSTPST